MARFLIKGGRLVDPSRKLDEVGDLWIEDGRIQERGSARKASADEVLDARGLLVVPGLVDMHVHLREPGMEEEETIASGAQAAVAGGITAVAAMPNTSPPVDNEASAEFVILQGARAGKARILPVGAITKNREGKELAEIGRLARAGAVAFSDDGAPVASAEILRRALAYARMFDRPVIDHCEDRDLSEGGVMHEGLISTRLGLPGISAESESIVIERDIALAEATGGHLHIAHLSTAKGVDAVRRGKSRGVRVTAEVTPHHLALTDEAVSGFDANFKMNPPLRTRSDQKALVDGLADGTIDAVASDHAPHSRESKEVEFARAPFGVIGMETTLAVVWTALGKAKTFTWLDLLSKLSTAPARILRLAGGGTLAPGANADIALIDPERTWTVDPERFFSKSRNCPFAGRKLISKVVATLVSGEVKFRES